MNTGRDIAQAVSRRLPAQVRWDLWWIKLRWGKFSPSTLVSRANSHSTDYSTFINYHPVLVQ
jgi:hypothetical protein